MDRRGKMSYNRVNIKFKSDLCGFCSRKTLVFTLLLMLTLVSSSFISVANGQLWCGNMFEIYVENEVELREAISAAPDRHYMIGITEDIVLEKPLEISKGKNIGLGGNRCLIGANGVDTVIVKSGGWLALWNGVIVTHVAGDTGRGVYVERGGVLELFICEISGNTAAKGGGVYNEGTVRMVLSDGIVSGSGVISGNTAVEGGGVYNTGTFTLEGGMISNNKADVGGGVYNNFSGSNFTMTGGEISGNTATGGGDVHNSGNFYRLSGVISANTVNDADGVYIDKVSDTGGNGGQLWLIVIAMVSAGFVVVLLFYHSKSRKQSSAITGEVLNLCGNLEGYV
jgi:hypothetical protein